MTDKSQEKIEIYHDVLNEIAHYLKGHDDLPKRELIEACLGELRRIGVPTSCGLNPLPNGEEWGRYRSSVAGEPFYADSDDFRDGDMLITHNGHHWHGMFYGHTVFNEAGEPVDGRGWHKVASDEDPERCCMKTNQFRRNLRKK